MATRISSQTYTMEDARRTSRFYDALHVYYENVGIFDEDNPYVTSYGLLRDRVAAQGIAEKIHGGVVLDAGCGAWQKGVRILKRFGPRKIYAVDFNEASLQHCRQDPQADTEYLCQDLADLTFGDNTFDVIVCEGVLHHTVEPAKTLAELLRVLKPGGYLTLGVYCWRFPYTLLSRILRGTLGRHLQFSRFLNNSAKNKVLLIFADFIFVPIEHTIREKVLIDLLGKMEADVIFNDAMVWPLPILKSRSRYFYRLTGLNYRHVFVRKKC